jgi:hypothetical protein
VPLVGVSVPLEGLAAEPLRVEKKSAAEMHRAANRINLIRKSIKLGVTGQTRFI